MVFENLNPSKNDWMTFSQCSVKHHRLQNVMTDYKILYYSVKINIKNKTLKLKTIIYATSEFRNPNIIMYSMRNEY